MGRLLTLLALLFSSPALFAGDIQQLLQLIDYVGVDYAEAVENGVVTNPAEYAEMQDFSAGIAQQVRDLPENPAKNGLLEDAARLASLIDAKTDATAVNLLCAGMSGTVIDSYRVSVVPRKQPDLGRGALLYSESCAGCHGMNGDGLGPLAADMDPPPINFLDTERFSQRSLYGLYNTITRGVPGTGMPAFHELSAEDRWSLAFYTGQFAVSETLRENGARLVTDAEIMPLQDIRTLAMVTPAQAASKYGTAGADLAAYLRTRPDLLFASRSPLEYSRLRLDDVATAYREGKRERAYRLAVDAYLEGFELVEQGLNAVAPELRVNIEQAMTGLRSQIRNDIPAIELDTRIRQIQQQLDLAGERLNERNLSATAAFASAFFILLREGLEALLVVAALAAFLLKTEHAHAMRYLHYGWIGALGAGFLTWWASVSLIEVSGVSREISEGVAALVATVLLFYVGYWLQNKSHATQWKQFIEGMIHKAMSSGTLWGLTGLSFIAVYREVFETILFYQALWIQTDSAGKTMALSGFGTAVGVLAVLGWLLLRYSVRLPLRQFFSFTGILMLALAVIFAGKGVAALQETGYIPMTPVSFPSINLLGVYPNLQGLLLQAGLVLLAILLWYGFPARRSAAT